jgi:aerobic carbon-monoxide dehydrogenase medium subunit
MKPAPFRRHAPEQPDEAVALLGEHGDDAKVLAGGQSLVPMLALRLARFGHLVDVNGVASLSGTARTDGWVRIGATTRHRTIERDPLIGQAVPLLARATAQVGHVPIRNRGTLGGALAHADPAAEQPAVALALDAVMEVASPTGTRDIAAGDFFRGTWATALGDDDLLTAVRFPVWEGRCGFAVEELARRHGDFALVGVVCAVGLSADRIDRAALGLFGVASTPVRAAEAERALVEGRPPQEVAATAAAAIDPADDLHATGEYRRQVAGVLVKRAVARALEEAHRA